MTKFVLPWILLPALLLAGCATTKQAGEVELSGFLKDTSQLKAGVGDEPLLYYCDKTVDFKKYDSIIIDPIQIWYGKGSALKDAPKEDLEGIVSHFNTAVNNALKTDLQIVTTPRSGALRLRVALTDAESSAAFGDTVTTVIPQLRMITSLVGLTTGSYLWTGSARVEAEMLDASTGKRLIAGADKRIGTKALSGVTGSWDDVKEACDYWATGLKKRLAKLQGRVVE